MYYPYLRGRQNELLCLRELLQEERLPDCVIPILEPVRYSSTFFTTIKKFVEKGRDIIIIKNPAVGSYWKEYQETVEKLDDPKFADKREKLKATMDSYDELLNDSHVLFAYINNSQFLSDIRREDKDLTTCYLVSKGNGDYSSYQEYPALQEVKASFVPYSLDYLDFVEGKKIVLQDGYNKARRNVDYIDNPDEFFSRNHLTYKNRGYSGFSDYSIVGDEFEESGFAPLAVAIHIVYFSQNMELRVHHFVSDSNENISDPARKFGEAVKKLNDWVNQTSVKKTSGLNELLNCYRMGKFPGLGVIKKLSIKHHIELMGDYVKETA